MDPLIYTTMSGAARTLHALQVHANNMANADTDGFRADLEVARSQAVRGYGYDSRHLARTEVNTVSVQPGAIRETGRDLDAAIQGDGYFIVAMADGEAYTRLGNFTVDADGTLTVNGRPVLGEGGPVVLPDYISVNIGQDGTISAVLPGVAESQVIDRLALVTVPDEELVKTPDGLLRHRDGAPAAAFEEAMVLGGYLELSNVSAMEEMMSSMSLQRHFEIQMRLYHAASEMAEVGNRLIRGS